MPWWTWVLLVWSVLAPVLGVVLGRVIRAADRRETGAEPDPVRLPRPRAGDQSVGPKTATHPPAVSSSSRPPQVEP